MINKYDTQSNPIKQATKAACTAHLATRSSVWWCRTEVVRVGYGCAGKVRRAGHRRRSPQPLTLALSRCRRPHPPWPAASGVGRSPPQVDAGWMIGWPSDDQQTDHRLRWHPQWGYLRFTTLWDGVEFASKITSPDTSPVWLFVMLPFYPHIVSHSCSGVWTVNKEMTGPDTPPDGWLTCWPVPCCKTDWLTCWLVPCTINDWETCWLVPCSTTNLFTCALFYNWLTCCLVPCSMTKLFTCGLFCIWVTNLLTCATFYRWVTSLLTCAMFYRWVTSLLTCTMFYNWLTNLLTCALLYKWLTCRLVPFF